MTISADNTTTAARQVIMAARQLTSLAVSPQTLSRLLLILKTSGLNPQVTDIIRTDPALTALFLSLKSVNGTACTSPSIDERLAELSAMQIQSIILSAPLHSHHIDTGSNFSYRHLVLHSVAVACAASLIADIALDPSQAQLAFTAGLLHDIGKLALDRVMPRSFQRIVDSAYLNHQPLHLAELEHIDIDHTVIGKRLAEKWHLPSPIMYAIWLHHTDTEAMIQDTSDYRFVRVIRLADILARRSTDALSGSFDSPEMPQALVDSLGLSAADLEYVTDSLPGLLDKRTQLLALDDPDSVSDLPEILQQTASFLAEQNASLHDKNRNLMASSLQLDFVQNLFNEIDTLSVPIDVAASCAKLWQGQYQCGSVCLYFVSDSSDMTMEMVAIDRSGKLFTALPSTKGDNPVIPLHIKNDFDVVDDFETSAWILDQIDVDFDVQNAKMVPLLHCGSAIGVLVFEQTFVEPSKQRQLILYETPAAAVASSVAQSIALQKNSCLAERFATALGSASRLNDSLISTRTFAGIAEMAAGAGHELNNPLTVISGKSQMLADTEPDPDRKRTLEQIQTKAQQASRIISQMMTYAKPGTPKPAPFSLLKIINAAAELVAVAYQLEAIDMSINGIDDEMMVNVDPDQITPAITAILSNSLDAYQQGAGPVEVTSMCPQKPGFVSFLIKDQGCGMDAETVARAAIPFFSAKPAGRKRGMGLANAKRLIELNSGTIKLTSIPGKGTTVKLQLPL